MKKQKLFTLTEQILLLIADGMDFIENSRSLNKAFPYLLGDPSKARHFFKMQKYLEDRKKRKSISAIISSLKKRNLIKKMTKAGKYAYILTERGEKQIFNINIRNINKKKLPKGSWIMVLFDVPERMRAKRDSLRWVLVTLGFEQFQKSIWISPYDVYKEIKKYIEDLGIKKYVKILSVKDVANNTSRS